MKKVASEDLVIVNNVRLLDRIRISENKGAWV